MFRPLRTSSPSKSSATHALSLHDDSHSSLPDLTGLSPDEVHFIDAVIERAGPTATTFLAVLKAYNEILRERGWDSQDEVVYYGKLLKIGTLKGKNWGEKWMSVRNQNGHSGLQHARHASEDSISTHASKVPARVATRLTAGYRPVKREEDTFTLHSLENGVDTETDTTSVPETPRPAPRLLAQAARTPANTLGLVTGAPFRGHLHTGAMLGSTPRPARRPKLWESVSEQGAEEFVVDSSTDAPSSHVAATLRERTAFLYPKTPAAFESRVKPAPAVAAPTASHRAVAKAREQRAGVINEDDAWNKIRMVRDEEDADRFRQERLVERCWSIWRQGYEWAITTQEQIARARDTLVLRLAVQRWRQLTASHIDLASRVRMLADTRALKRAFAVWTARLAEKRQVDWRRDMRVKMKSVRLKREAKLCEDAWAKWRQSYRSRLSDQHYKERLVLRTWQHWKEAIREVQQLEAVAEDFDAVREGRSKDRAWEIWKRATMIRRCEVVVVERVGLRVLADTLEVWKTRTRQTQVANDFYDVICLRRAVSTWKGACLRVRAMERKADKHLARQDDVLIRAIIRVWKAHERGKLLERVRSSRLESQLWDVWKGKVHAQRQRQEYAVAFSFRKNSVLAANTLRTWVQALAAQRNAQAFADQFRATQLRYNMLLTWRRAVRTRQKIAKAARTAEKYLVLCRTWVTWRKKIEASRRERKAREFELGKVKRIFNNWLTRMQRHRQHKLAEQRIQQLTATRLMKISLSRWTNRVINLKLREIEIVQKNDANLLTLTFRKWKTAYTRHAEELSLMESYLDVKREETIRRMFYNWLNRARSARHLRVTLQDREEQIRIAKLTVAWDKWRDRFKDERLRIVEREVILQSQRNLLFRCFGIWHSKTNSLPAIHFEASHLKAKVWRKWRDSMPNAVLAKQARDVHAKWVLTKTMEKWSRAYKTKIALKAVARARYLRLPTAVPRQSLSSQRPASSTTIRPPFSRRVVRTSALAKETTTWTLDGASSQVTKLLAPTHRPLKERTSIIETVSTIDDKATEDSRPSQRSSRGRLSLRPAIIPGSGVLASTPLGHIGAGALIPSPRPRLFVARDSSPARSKVSSGLATPRAGADASSTKVSQPGSSVVGENGRSRLWMELREMQRKSRTPTDASMEPP